MNKTLNSEKQTEKLYNQIYKNAAMGAGTVKHLLRGKRGEQLEQHLIGQQAEYTAVCRNAERSLRERGAKIKGLSTAEKLRTDSAVSLNLMMGRSDSHVAEMLMNGSTMGIVQAQKLLNKYPDAEENARNLMKHLSDFEEQTLEKMKPFL